MVLSTSIGDEIVDNFDDVEDIYIVGSEKSIGKFTSDKLFQVNINNVFRIFIYYISESVKNN